MPEPGDDRLTRELRALADKGARGSSGVAAAEVRARGARRHRRRVTALATVVTLAVVGVGTVAFGTARDEAGRAPVAPATQEPGLTEADLPAAEELPGFNELTGWRATRTAPDEGQEPVSICQRSSVAGLGATDVFTRDYVSTLLDQSSTTTDPEQPPSTAGVVVAAFVDRQAARAAYDSLLKWVKTCKHAPGVSVFDDVAVNPIGRVEAAGGHGVATMVQYGPVEGVREGGWFDATAVGLSGDRVVLVSERLVGQDYNYPDGPTPIEGALTVALDRLAP